jgi:hypothetical protein
MQEQLCGNDAGCAAKKLAQLQQALTAHKCEMVRLMPQPLPVPVATPLSPSR